MKLQDLIVSDLMTRNLVSVRTTETLGFEISPEQIVDTLTMITTAQQPARVNEW